MNPYLDQLNKVVLPCDHHDLLEYAKENQVPIMTKDSLTLLRAILDLQGAQKILEIGTAIGYSALQMIQNHSTRIVDTIERADLMVQLAVQNIKTYHADNRIRVYHADALTIDLSVLSPEYDVLFIDAAKAQYQKFFERFAPLLKPNGIIITDNILFHGCIEQPQDLSKNVRHMVAKIDQYNHYLANLVDYQTYFIESGDGLAITMRKPRCN